MWGTLECDVFSLDGPNTIRCIPDAAKVNRFGPPLFSSWFAQIFRFQNNAQALARFGYYFTHSGMAHMETISQRMKIVTSG